MNADVFYIQNYLSHKQIYKKKEKERKKEWCGAVKGKDRYEIFSVFQDFQKEKSIPNTYRYIFL